jgi:hypothetical protein
MRLYMQAFAFVLANSKTADVRMYGRIREKAGQYASQQYVIFSLYSIFPTQLDREQVH